MTNNNRDHKQRKSKSSGHHKHRGPQITGCTAMLASSTHGHQHWQLETTNHKHTRLNAAEVRERGPSRGTLPLTLLSLRPPTHQSVTGAAVVQRRPYYQHHYLQMWEHQPWDGSNDNSNTTRVKNRNNGSSNIDDNHRHSHTNNCNRNGRNSIYVSTSCSNNCSNSGRQSTSKSISNSKSSCNNWQKHQHKIQQWPHY